MTEADLRRAILCDRRAILAVDGALVTTCPGDCLAHLLGWSGMYVTPLRNKRGQYQTPTRGDMGPGWPDLFLARAPRGKGGPNGWRRHGRVLWAELKRERHVMDPLQAAVSQLLRAATGEPVELWTPADLDSGAILAALQR